MKQADMFVRLDEDLLIKDFPSLAQIDSQLPDKAYLKIYEIKSVVGVGEDVFYKWIAQSKFNYLDLSTGSRPRYSIERKSFMQFLASRVNRIR